MRTLKKLILDERGMETVEWAVLAALIVAGITAIILGLGKNVYSAFSNLESATT